MQGVLQMSNEIYTIKRLSEELHQARQNIRRRIQKLDIKAVNEETRSYKNEPLEYDRKAFVKIAEDFGVSISNTDSTTKDTHSTTDDETKDMLIEVLREQLDIANKSRENLERLLNQQQQLSLNDKSKIKLLEIELEEVNDSKDEVSDPELDGFDNSKNETPEEVLEEKQKTIHEHKKTKWYEFWKPNK